MPPTPLLLRVFVASPADVGPERALVKEVTDELNLAWGPYLRISLELVRWETHAYPAAGDDAQDVINRQIGDEYELFIGIMWTRFGTPTGRGASGTAEEFARAYARRQADPRSVDIMFYFKDTPVAPSQLDYVQAQQVQAFRRQLGEQGVLYWSFRSAEEFAGRLRIHLAHQLQRWLERHRDDDDFAATLAEFDVLIERASASTVIAQAMSRDLQDRSRSLTATLGRAVSDIERIKAGGGDLAAPAVTAIIDSVALSLVEWGTSVWRPASTQSAQLILSNELLAAALPLLNRLRGDTVRVGTTIDVLVGMQATTAELIVVYRALQASLESLPSATPSLALAKTVALAAVNTLIDETVSLDAALGRQIQALTEAAVRT